MKLFSLEAELSLNTSGFTSGINTSRNQMEDMKNDMGGVQEEATKTGGILESALGHAIGDFIADVGSQLGQFVVDFTGDSIELASSVEQTNEKLKVLFGDEGAASIRAWATTTKEQFGISEQAAKKYVADIAGLWGGEHLGFTTEELMDMATSLVELTGDLASFNNFTVQETWTKILSGMRGETEAIEDLGIDLRAASIAPYFDMNVDAWGKLDQKERIEKTYEYALAMTTKAQGDFARTGDTFQNQMAMLTANVEELQATLGDKLLPVATEIVTWMNSLFGAGEGGAEAMKDMSTELGETYATIDTTTTNALALINALAEMEAAGVDTANEQSVWNQLLKDLSGTMPEISGLIDTTTGSINGGTEALKEYVQQWQESQKQIAMTQAVQELQNEVTKAQTELLEAQWAREAAERTPSDAEAQRQGYVDRFKTYLLETGEIGQMEAQYMDNAAVEMMLVDMYEAGDAFAVMIAGVIDSLSDDESRLSQLRAKEAAAQLKFEEAQAKMAEIMQTLDYMQNEKAAAPSETKTGPTQGETYQPQPLNIELKVILNGEDISAALVPSVTGAVMGMIDWQLQTKAGG